MPENTTENELSASDSNSELSELLCLDGLDGMDQSAKLELLDDALHRLGFERRLAALTPKQLEHMEGHLSEQQIQHIESCETDEKKEEAITGYARTMYFRKCMWVDYLNGGDPNPPVAA